MPSRQNLRETQGDSHGASHPALFQAQQGAPKTAVTTSEAMDTSVLATGSLYQTWLFVLGEGPQSAMLPWWSVMLPHEAVFETWARAESYPLAVKIAYQGGTLGVASREDRAVVLSSAYSEAAKDLSIRRVVLSGYRLADVLAALFPATPRGSIKYPSLVAGQ